MELYKNIDVFSLVFSSSYSKLQYSFNVSFSSPYVYDKVDKLSYSHTMSTNFISFVSKIPKSE